MTESWKGKQCKSFYELLCFLLLYSMSYLSLSKSCKGVTPDKYHTLSHTLAQHITVKRRLQHMECCGCSSTWLLIIG